MIAEIKKAYQEQLAAEKKTARANELAAATAAQPIAKGFITHPEEEPKRAEINSFLIETGLDIYGLTAKIRDAAANYQELMQTAKDNLAAIEERVLAERTRLEDINVIKGEYSEFRNAKALTQNDFTGDFGSIGAAIAAPETTLSAAELKVETILGNGYEGNSYVYADGSFPEETESTADRAAITDGSFTTFYEYSRLTATKKEDDAPTEINIDNQEAECSIVLSSETQFNTISVESEKGKTILTGLFVSQDGIAYTKILDRPMKLKDANLLSMPLVYYVKLVLKSDGVSNDKIAYKKTKLLSDETAIIETEARRHVIKLNGVTAWNRECEQEGNAKTEELLSGEVKSIAILAEEYSQSGYGNFAYTLTINGKDYPVEPLNSEKAGVKVIRNVSLLSPDGYALHIAERIQSAVLSIKIKAPYKTENAYISDIKVVTG
jgi:hypothetical protein